MTVIAKPLAAAFHLSHWVLPRLSFLTLRRRQATIDLIHSSPYLLRDIGATENHFSQRTK